jgi:hypothetical protein
MRTSAARALHLALFGLGTLLYIVFVLPRWWVMTGDIPRALATAGRIAAGIPIGLAAWPVLQLLKAGLGATPRPPEIALRLRAWSAVLHVVAGVLILLAAIVEIWLRLQVGAPWLFGVYGAAAAIAILGLLALYLSFVAEQPPSGPKPPKAEREKAKTASGQAKKPTTKRGRKKAAPANDTPEAPEPTEVADTADAPADEAVVVTDTDSAAPDVVVTVDSDLGDTDVTATEQPSPLRNKRPAGKNRRRLSR